MREDEWMETLSRWAHAQPDITALVQIGSRVQLPGRADVWSDFDYQLISSQPKRYLDGRFAYEICPCWAVGINRAFGNVTKVSAVFDDALEAEFVILRNWEVKAATTALRWPSMSKIWPTTLRRGVEDLRGVAGSGWRMIKGGTKWSARYARLLPFQERITQSEFDSLCGEFWTHFVWTIKKTQRGEFLAAQRAIHEVLLESTIRLLAEEGLLDGKGAGPRGRRAERWLTRERLEAVKVCSYPDRDMLFAAFFQLFKLFDEVSSIVAQKNHWTYNSYSEVRAWIGVQCSVEKR